MLNETQEAKDSDKKQKPTKGKKLFKRKIVAALVLTFSEAAVRRFLLIGLGSYFVMRVWSGVYFIREMLTFQKIPLDAPPSPELSARVANWTFWTWFREPLDVLSFLCFLLALYNLRR